MHVYCEAESPSDPLVVFLANSHAEVLELPMLA